MSASRAAGADFPRQGAAAVGGKEMLAGVFFRFLRAAGVRRLGGMARGRGGSDRGTNQT